MKHPVAEAAVFFRNAAPDRFNAFVNAIENEANHVIKYMLEVTEPTDIMRCQGRAQQLRWLLQILKECHVDRK